MDMDQNRSYSQVFLQHRKTNINWKFEPNRIHSHEQYQVLAYFLLLPNMNTSNGIHVHMIHMHTRMCPYIHTSPPKVAGLGVIKFK